MPATRTRKTAAKPKAAPKPAPEELEEELTEDEAPDVDEDFEPEADEDLEELEEDEVSETKPATKKSSAAQEVTFGIRDLCALIKKKTGDDVDPRAIRTLIRKMARDKSGRIDREIVPGNRQRYDWSGPNDPEVTAIIKAYQGGELEAEKQAKLAALKEQKAAKTAAKKAAAAKEADEEVEEETPKPARRAKKTTASKRKAKPAPVEEVEDDEELELDDEE